MKNKTSTFFSLGASTILIALGVWLLYNYSFGIWPGHHRWVMGHHDFMGGGMGIVMVIFWIVIFAALALLLSGTIARVRDSKKSQDGGSSTMEILKQRYARGEIDKKEFEEMKQVLMN